MTNTAHTLADANWFTSSYSNDQGGQCVECAHLREPATAVRDSKNRTGSAFVVPGPAWQSFISALKDNELSAGQ
jgi:hypothetical protein